MTHLSKKKCTNCGSENDLLAVICEKCGELFNPSKGKSIILPKKRKDLSQEQKDILIKEYTLVLSPLGSCFFRGLREWKVLGFILGLLYDMIFLGMFFIVYVIINSICSYFTTHNTQDIGLIISFTIILVIRYITCRPIAYFFKREEMGDVLIEKTMK